MLHSPTGMRSWSPTRPTRNTYRQLLSFMRYVAQIDVGIVVLNCCVFRKRPVMIIGLS